MKNLRFGVFDVRQMYGESTVILIVLGVLQVVVDKFIEPYL